MLKLKDAALLAILSSAAQTLSLSCSREYVLVKAEDLASVETLAVLTLNGAKFGRASDQEARDLMLPTASITDMTTEAAMQVCQPHVRRE